MEVEPGVGVDSWVCGVVRAVEPLIGAATRWFLNLITTMIVSHAFVLATSDTNLIC